MNRGAGSIFVIALLGASLVASCSDSGSSATRASSTSSSMSTRATAVGAVARVRHAIGITRAARTAKYASRLVLDVTGQEANVGTTGVVNFGAKRASWVTDLSTVAGQRAPAGTPRSDLVLRAREIGTDLYVSFPIAFRAAGVSATWVHATAVPAADITPSTRSGAVGARVLLVSRIERPEVAFNLVRTARSAREVGPALTRGVATTQYTTVVMLREFLNDVGLRSLFGTPKTARDLRTIDRLLVRAARADVFVDAVGRLRALLIDVDLSLLAPHFRPPRDPHAWRELRIQWEFSGFGGAAPVVRPVAGVQPAG